jgi:hypothetical protein
MMVAREWEGIITRGVGQGAKVTALLREYPDDVQRLAHEARRAVREWLPGADESVDVPARLLSYSYGPGYKGTVCTLILSKKGIKLGLAWGATLPDPRGLLDGSGKVHRHVQLSKPEDLNKAGVKTLVRAARRACRKRLAEK